MIKLTTSPSLGKRPKDFFEKINFLSKVISNTPPPDEIREISILEKLAKLKEQGHLTEEEYNEKKKELL